jgi:hypothetical protein
MANELQAFAATGATLYALLLDGVGRAWLCPIGTIKATCSAAATGVIKWYAVYKPLSQNSIMAAAA